MPVNTNGKSWIYCLNVGQGDTTIVATPGNKILVIDAANGKKIIQLLKSLSFGEGDLIDQIVISHPHHDHYSGIIPLLNTYKVKVLTLTSVRHVENSTPSYNNIINTAVSKGIPINFLSGYTQIYPDHSPVVNPNTFVVELLGPSNQFIEDLYQAGNLNTNHYSIISQLNWMGFRMVIAGDAQMETWAHFDNEQMLAGNCSVLRSAHHGSANGTQFERLEKLKPRLIVVSSDPGGKDKIPDLIGSVIFMRFSGQSSTPIVALTDNPDAAKTGTIKIEVHPSGRFNTYCYGDKKDENVNLGNEKALTSAGTTPTWRELTNKLVAV